MDKIASATASATVSPTAALPTAASVTGVSPTTASPTAASPTASPTAPTAAEWVSCLCLPFKCIGLMLILLGIGLIALGLILVGIFFILFRLFGADVFMFLVPRPHVVSTTVDSVSVTQFTLSPNSALQYNITLATTIHNPNKRINLYFHEVESMTLFDGKRFGYAQLQDFYQRTRSSTQLTLAFQGQQPIEGSTAANYRHQQAGGVFSVDVKLNGKIGKKVWLIPEVKGPKVRMTCELSLPANSSASDTFKPTDVLGRN